MVVPRRYPPAGRSSAARGLSLLLFSGLLAIMIAPAGLRAQNAPVAGLQVSEPFIATTAFYHDRDDASRAWSKRYFARMQRMPGMVQASVYSAVLHYLRAVRDAGTTDGPAVAAKMRDKPVDDFFAPGATIRVDGRLLNDMYLVEVKSPAESKAPWDYFKILRTIPAKDIAKPLAESKCYLVK